ncbi:HAD-IB family phosphatase [Dehalococcoides mccartyi]|nr:HAD-IB family phosphatase [Dehalococcoides mccartyi]
MSIFPDLERAKQKRVLYVTYQGLVVFDVDGTLIREKTVCELIAEKIDKVERMAWLEQNAGSLRTSTNAPKNASVIAAREEMADWYIEAGRESVDTFIDSVIWAEAAHVGIKSLTENGYLVALSSMTWSFGVEKIASDLGISDFQGSDLDWDTKQVDHVFPEDKVGFLQGLVAEHEIPNDQIYAVGDSGGDVPMLKAATHGFYLGDSDPQIPGTIHMPNAGIGTIAQHILNSDN